MCSKCIKCWVCSRKCFEFVYQSSVSEEPVFLILILRLVKYSIVVTVNCLQLTKLPISGCHQFESYIIHPNTPKTMKWDRPNTVCIAFGHLIFILRGEIETHTTEWMIKAPFTQIKIITFWLNYSPMNVVKPVSTIFTSCIDHSVHNTLNPMQQSLFNPK
jgi:hypothetical protein